MKKNRRSDYQSTLGESSSSETEEVTENNDNEYNEKYHNDDAYQPFKIDKIYELEDNNLKTIIIDDLKKKYNLNDFIIKDLVSFFTLDYFRHENFKFCRSFAEEYKIYAEDKITKYIQKVISSRMSHISKIFAFEKKKFCQLLSDHEYLYDNAISGIIADYVCEIDYHSLFNDNINAKYKKFLLMQCCKLEVLARRREAQNICVQYITNNITDYTNFCYRYDQMTYQNYLKPIILNSNIYGKIYLILSRFRRVTIFRSYIKPLVSLKKRKYNLEKTKYTLRCCVVSKLFLIQLAFIFFYMIDIWLSAKYCFKEMTCFLINLICFQSFLLIFFPLGFIFLFKLSSLSICYSELDFYKAENEILNFTKTSCFGTYDPLYPGYCLRSKWIEKLESYQNSCYNCIYLAILYTGYWGYICCYRLSNCFGLG